MLATGWLDGTRWMEGFPLGLWEANCYLLGDAETGGCVVVDPGQAGGPAVMQRLRDRDARCEAILLTHGHLDHVWAVPDLAAELDVPVFLHPDDRWLWDDPAAGLGVTPDILRQQFGFEWDPPTEHLLEMRGGQRLLFGGVSIEVRHTPGHTPGSCVFLLDDVAEDPVLLSGDLLFAGSVGRTDFPRGSARQQEESLAREVLVLPDGTRVAPGHGPDTTVGAERATNPFLRGSTAPGR
jgi:hydroxyacylglutathione hydrolase